MSIQDVQGYWNRRPCNVQHSLTDIDKFPGVYSWQVSNRKYRVEPHIPAFADFPRWDGKTVLELGCGIGTDALSFAAHGARVLAIDISAASLRVAWKRAWGLGLNDRIAFVQGNMEALNTIPALWPGRQFDLVYSFGALHHTPRPSLAVQALRPYMHRGSLLKIMLYHRYTPKVLSALVHHWRPGRSIDQAVAQMSEAQSGCPVTYTYTRKSAVKLLRGFEILDMHVDHIFPYKVRDYMNYKYTIQWYWRILPPGLFRLLEKKWGWHLLITARLK